MRASPDTEPLDFEAPLVFAGYGLDLPAHGFDDYRGIDARGKVVVVIEGIPSGVPSDVAAHLSSEKRRMAGARGALGMITIRTRASNTRVPWERVLRFGLLAHLADPDDLATEPPETAHEDVAQRPDALADPDLALVDHDLRFIDALEAGRHRANLRLDVAAGVEDGVPHENRRP